MSVIEFLIFFGALSVPVAMMLAHDHRVAAQHGMKLTELPALFNRYCTLIVLAGVYGGTFYVLVILYVNGYLDSGQSLNLYDMHDFFVPTACISTVSILLFGYIMQADNAFYLNALMAGKKAAGGKRDLICRTFRSISMGQIAPGIVYPLSVSLWALHGAWLYNIYTIVMRSSNQDLMPRVLFIGAVRMILALFIGVLIYCLFQAFFKPYATSGVGDDKALVIQNEKAAYFLVACAFFSGLFPLQAAQAAWQKAKSSELIGEIFSPAPTLSMEHLQGMNAFMRDRLFEEGVVDVHQLATLGKRRDLLYSRIQNLISEEQLDDWTDQASLMLFIHDSDLLQALRSAGIRKQSQLDDVMQTNNKALLLQALNTEGDAALRHFIQKYSLTHYNSLINSSAGVGLPNK